MPAVGHAHELGAREARGDRATLSLATATSRSPVSASAGTAGNDAARGIAGCGRVSAGHGTQSSAGATCEPSQRAPRRARTRSAAGVRRRPRTAGGASPRARTSRTGRRRRCRTSRRSRRRSSSAGRPGRRSHGWSVSAAMRSSGARSPRASARAAALISAAPRKPPLVSASRSITRASSTTTSAAARRRRARSRTPARAHAVQQPAQRPPRMRVGGAAARRAPQTSTAERTRAPPPATGTRRRSRPVRRVEDRRAQPVAVARGVGLDLQPAAESP